MSKKSCQYNNMATRHWFTHLSELTSDHPWWPLRPHLTSRANPCSVSVAVLASGICSLGYLSCWCFLLVNALTLLNSSIYWQVCEGLTFSKFWFKLIQAIVHQGVASQKKMSFHKFPGHLQLMKKPKVFFSGLRCQDISPFWYCVNLLWVTL